MTVTRARSATMTSHLLVADDDRAIREALQRALELDGDGVPCRPPRR